MIHAGKSLSRGHFYAYVLSSTGCWAKMDDKVVTQVRYSACYLRTAHGLLVVHTADESASGATARACIGSLGSLILPSTHRHARAKLPDWRRLPNRVLNDAPPTPISQNTRVRTGRPQDGTSRQCLHPVLHSTPGAVATGCQPVPRLFLFHPHQPQGWHNRQHQLLYW